MLAGVGRSLGQRLSAFRRQVTLISVAGVLVVATIGASGYLVLFLRQSALKTAKEHTGNLALVIAEQTSRALRSVALVTSGVVYELQKSTSTEGFLSLAQDPAFRSRLRDRVAGLPDLDNVAIVTAEGRLINRTRPGPIPSVDLSRRDYLAELRDAAPFATYISKPTRSPTTGTWEVALANRITGTRGEFLGAVIGVVELHNFEDLYAKVALGVHGSISLTRKDGVHLARFPHIDSEIGRSHSGSYFFQTLVAKDRNGVIRQISPIDGVDRLVAAQHVNSFPLVVAVTMAVPDVLAEWQRQALVILLSSVLACAVMIGGTILLVRRVDALAKARFELGTLRERERVQKEIALQLERFDAAIQNMSQGLAMFDEDERLIVCNQRYADLYRLPSHLARSGIHRSELIAHRRTMQTDKIDGHTQRSHVGQEEILINRLRDGRVISVKHRSMSGGGFVSTHEDVTELRKAEAKITYLAEHDSLTDLPNRARFRADLQQLLDAPARDPIAVLYIDLDRFKPVNDSLGHVTGDGLLQAVAARLRNFACFTSMARLGGDEFAVISRVRDASVADRQACDVIEQLSRAFEVDGHSITIGASIGIALAPRDGSTADELTANADLALYAAKAAGRGIHRFFDPDMGLQIRARRDFEADLRVALEHGEFELHYQPLVSIRDRSVQSFEALLRWNSAKRGFVSPADFVPVAEEIGLICDIGEWVLREACRCAATWPDGLRVAINLSAVQIKGTDLVTTVADALARAGLPGERLELEITESVLLQDVDKTVELLHALRDMGIRIAMDDFGTGYSSLNYLRLFPFDKLKIDRAFVQEIELRTDCAAIVRATTSLARSLNMVTTAEGVETESQLLRVAMEGCTEAQGYLFSKPLPERDLQDFLNRHQTSRAA